MMLCYHLYIYMMEGETWHPHVWASAYSYASESERNTSAAHRLGCPLSTCDGRSVGASFSRHGHKFGRAYESANSADCTTEGGGLHVHTNTHKDRQSWTIDGN